MDTLVAQDATNLVKTGAWDVQEVLDIVLLSVEEVVEITVLTAQVVETMYIL